MMTFVIAFLSFLFGFFYGYFAGGDDERGYRSGRLKGPRRR